MDVQKVFRNLVTNQYMPEFDYEGTQFSFRTVFHLSNHAYCACVCCYEHEYLDYISDQGEIDEEKYNRVLQCIVDGECPHVNQVPEEYVEETSISTLHLAEAVGTIQAITGEPLYSRNVLYFIARSPAALTSVNPIALASLHNNTATASIPGFIIDLLQVVNYGMRTREKDSNEIYIEQTKLVELLAKQGNLPFSVKYLRDNGICHLKHVTDTLQLSFKHKLSNLQELILDSIECFVQDNSQDLGRYNLVQHNLQDLGEICQLAIIWNQPEVLNLILAIDKEHVLRQYSQNKYNKMLSKMCHAFQRYECIDVLLKYGILIENVSFRNDYELMKWLLRKSWQYSVNMKKVFSMGHNTVPNLLAPDTLGNSNRQQDDQQYSVFHHYHEVIYKYDIDKVMTEPRHSCPTYSEDVTHVLSFILDNGLDINVRDSKTDSSPFEDFLSRFPPMLGYHCHHLQYYMQYRQIAEVYIYGNPDLNQKKPVTAALRTDADLYNSNYFKADWHLFTTFAGRGIPVKMDGKEHAIFGHDDKASFALNFMAPLLVECGFTISTEAMRDFEKSQESLHPAQVEYLKFCLQNPRTLELCSRDVLRKHFRGRLIHKFVEGSELPQEIKDYILLKPLLKSVPNQLHVQPRKMQYSNAGVSNISQRVVKKLKLPILAQYF